MEPATFSLGFFRPDGPCPAQWYIQPNTGRYKAHRFFSPTEANCADVYNTFLSREIYTYTF